MSTHGPAYDEAIDGERVATQREVIRDQMLRWNRAWFTLSELERRLGYPQASISAQLRHLRKQRFGGYNVEKRRCRFPPNAGTWEYQVREPLPTGQGELWEE